MSNEIGLKRKRKVLTIHEKLQVIELFDKGASVKQLMTQFGIGEQTVRDIKKQKSELMSFAESAESYSTLKNRKSMKKSTYDDLDKAMLKWFTEQRANGTPITGVMCVKTANYFFEALGLEGKFNASSGWLTRFKQRHGIHDTESRPGARPNRLLSLRTEAKKNSVQTMGDAVDKTDQLNTNFEEKLQNVYYCISGDTQDMQNASGPCPGDYQFVSCDAEDERHTESAQDYVQIKTELDDAEQQFSDSDGDPLDSSRIMSSDVESNDLHNCSGNNEIPESEVQQDCVWIKAEPYDGDREDSSAVSCSVMRNSDINNLSERSELEKAVSSCTKMWIKEEVCIEDVDDNLQEMEDFERNRLNATVYTCDFDAACHDHTYTKECFLEKHKLINSDHKQYSCDVCNKVFLCQSALKTHKLIHRRVNIHKCNVCNREFSKMSALENHTLIHRVFMEHQCDVCGKTFKKLSGLRKHKSRHSNKKKFQCDMCSRSFTCPGQLEYHKLFHSDIKQFLCKVCNKPFSRLGTLNRHRLTHSSIKGYQCDVCDKAFKLPGTLREHKLTHSGVKKYQCDICNKVFTQSSTLSHHKLIHSGGNQFQCDICDKTFATPVNIRRHKRRCRAV